MTANTNLLYKKAISDSQYKSDMIAQTGDWAEPSILWGPAEKSVMAACYYGYLVGKGFTEEQILSQIKE